MNRGVWCTSVTVLTAIANSQLKEAYLPFQCHSLPLFCAKVHKKSQVDFKVAVLKRETDMNSANNANRASLPVTLTLLQEWKISYSLVFLILSVTVLHRPMLVSVVETCIFTSSPDQVMLLEVLTLLQSLSKTVSTFLLFVDHKLFMFRSSGMKII